MVSISNVSRIGEMTGQSGAAAHALQDLAVSASAGGYSKALGRALLRRPRFGFRISDFGFRVSACYFCSAAPGRFWLSPPPRLPLRIH
jgi:hypothetical protein